MGQRYPAPITPAMVLPAYVPVITYTGGLYGDDVDIATATTTTPYTPKHQAEKASMLGTTLAVDVGRPRGTIAPNQPYPKVGDTPAPAPTISSLAPNTAVAGGPDIVVVINGTGFTQWTKILNGGVQNMTAYYVSPTKMAMLFEVSSSVAGTVQVIAVDHSVSSAASNFTFT
jgi:hypothetical protein